MHCVVAQSASAQTFISEEARYLTGLRERRLFELAESYCRRELAESYVVRRRRAELTIELSRTILESALYEKPPRRDERFAAAAKVLDEARFEGPDDPWRIAVGVQRGLIDLIQGELLREEAQSLSASDAALNAARDRLRSAIAQLRKSLAAVEELSRSAARSGTTVPSRPDEPTSAEAVAIKRQVDYQLARAYRNQGESYPPASPDRAAALAEATKALEQLARSETNDDLTWQARLDEVVCRRLLGDLDGAERMLGLIDGQSPPDDVADRARAQRIHIRLDAAQLDDAQPFIRETDVDPGRSNSPEVQLAVLEWMLAQSRTAAKAGRTQDADDWQNRAAALTKIIAERQSPNWSRRAESLLASATAIAPTGDVALLIKAAESFYQQGNVDRALEVYQRAFETARDANDAAGAMSAGLTAAAIQINNKRESAAIAQLLELAAAYPSQPRAADAHLTAALLTAQHAVASTDRQQELLATYSRLLTEHVARWPDDPSSARAYCSLGLLRKFEKQWPAAIDALSRVPPDSLHAAEAVDALVACWEASFAEKQAAAHPLPILELERSLATFAPGLLGRLENPQSPAVRRVAWAAARLWLRYTHDRYPQASALLAQLRGSAEDAAERAAVDAWLVAADVGLQRYDAALARAQALPAELAAAEVDVVACLDALAQLRAPAARPKIAAVTLELLKRLPGESSTRRRAEARALSYAGRTAEAREIWDRLTAAAPADVDLAEEHAEFLLTQPDRVSAAAAAARWRTVERASKESTSRWYRARLGLAKAYLQSGDRARALQLIEITTALHPDLGGDAMRSQFEALTKKLR